NFTKVHQGNNTQLLYQAKLAELEDAVAVRVEFDNLQPIGKTGQALGAVTLTDAEQLALGRSSVLTGGSSDLGVAVHDVRIYAHIVTDDEWTVLAADKPVHQWQPEQAIDGDENTFWESGGAATPDAHEWLIVDVRDGDGNAQRIDKIRIDPVW